MNNFITLIISFLSFGLLGNIILPKIKFFRPYKQIKPDDQLQWHFRTTSTIHAIVVTAISIFVVLYRKNPGINFENTTLSSWNVAFSSGYLIADFFAICIYYERIGGDKGYLIHHIISIIAFTLCIYRGLLSYYANYRLLSEASSSFLNFRWKLYVTGRYGSSTYFWNGIAIIVFYFACRILPIPYFWISVNTLIRSEDYRVDLLSHCTWLSICLILDVLNCYWFYLLTSKSVKHLSMKKETNKPSSS